MKILCPIYFCGLLLGACFGVKAETIITTDVRYQSRSDSPWREGISAGTIYVDTLETNNAPLNLPGVTTLYDNRVGGNWRHGVDEDDGVLDGFGRSLSLLRGGQPFVFTLSPDIKGHWPNYFGGVEVESWFGINPWLVQVQLADDTFTTFSTISPNYASPGSNATDAYGTFFGIYDSRGIKQVSVNMNYIDHVHVGWQIPEPSTVLAAMTLGILSLGRRRNVQPDLT